MHLNQAQAAIKYAEGPVKDKVARKMLEMADEFCTFVLEKRDSGNEKVRYR